MEPLRVDGEAEGVLGLDPDRRVDGGAEALTVPRRDHMRTLGDRVYREGVLAFLRRRE
jgi:hypothetical protein